MLRDILHLVVSSSFHKKVDSINPLYFLLTGIGLAEASFCFEDSFEGCAARTMIRGSSLACQRSMRHCCNEVSEGWAG